MVSNDEAKLGMYEGQAKGISEKIAKTGFQVDAGTRLAKEIQDLKLPVTKMIEKTKQAGQAATGFIHQMDSEEMATLATTELNQKMIIAQGATATLAKVSDKAKALNEQEIQVAKAAADRTDA